MVVVVVVVQRHTLSSRGEQLTSVFATSSSSSSSWMQLIHCTQLVWPTNPPPDKHSPDRQFHTRISPSDPLTKRSSPRCANERTCDVWPTSVRTHSPPQPPPPPLSSSSCNCHILTVRSREPLASRISPSPVRAYMDAA